MPGNNVREIVMSEQNFKKLVGTKKPAGDSKDMPVSTSLSEAPVKKLELPKEQQQFRLVIKKNIPEPASVLTTKPYVIERVPTGIEGLDDLMEGGVEKGSSVLLLGSAGSGKTLFGLQFLYRGAKDHGEPGIFISFEEDRESLFRHSSHFNWDLEKLEKQGLFRVLKYKPHQVEKLMKEGGGFIKDLIKSLKAERLVLDSVTSYGLLFKDEYAQREGILELFEMLQKWGCTSIIIDELPATPTDIREDHVGFLADAIIAMYYMKEGTSTRTHACEILKMRGTQHTNKLLALRFEKDGIVVHPDVEVF